jgi:hypothetical protein
VGEARAVRTVAVTPAALPGRPARWPVLVAGALWALTMLGLAVTVWLNHLLSSAGTPQTYLQAANLPEMVAAVSAATVGAVLASRRPRHPVGWLLLALGLLTVAGGVAWGYSRYGVVARPGALPGAAYPAGISNGGTAFLMLLCAGFVGLLTPTGSLPMGGGWRWWARIAALAAGLVLVSSAMDPQPMYPEYPAVTNPLFVPALRWPLQLAGAAGTLVALAAPVVAAASLVVRFRRARGVERQQLRWLAFAAALAALALLVAVAAGVMERDRVVMAAAGTCLALLPLATGAAILRYRLYDLDRIISRTLAYGLLTVLLGGAYAGIVLGLGQLLGRNSSLAVAAATLAVAAAFQPARRRVQQAVDRRFNRRRYDAARTIQGFSARLRQQVDLDTLTGELLGVVEQTMQPASVSLWLRPSAGAAPDRGGAVRAAL